MSAAISRVGGWQGGQIVGVVLLGYGLRFLRWQVYLNALRHPLPWRPSLKIYLAGFALTTTPGKAGEALRGVLLKRWDVPYAHSFAALFSERLADLPSIAQAVLERIARDAGVEPLPEVKPYETYNYAAVDQRSPFEAGVPASLSAPGALRPDANRPREFLEQFSLDTLRMVGAGLGMMGWV